MAQNQQHPTSGARRDGPQVRLSRLVALALAVHAAALGSLLLPTTPPIGYLRAVVVFLDLALIPGFLAVALVDDSLLDDGLVAARLAVYAVGLGLMVVMATGFLVDLLLLEIGYARPLSVGPLAAGVTATVVGLALAVAVARDLSRTVPLGASVRDVSPTPLALLLLPPLAILAVRVRPVTIVPVLVVLVAIALVPFLVARSILQERWHALVVWTTAVALLYHKTLAGRFRFAGQPSVVNAWRLERWTPGLQQIYPTTTSILPNGVLFPTYARLSGLDILAELNVLNPLLVSILPVALFLVYRRYTNSTLAALGASLFVFAHPFYNLYPQGGRVATPVIFLGLFALALADDRLASLTRTGFALVFVLGVAISHYGTSYYVLFALLGAGVVLVGFALSDALLDRFFGRRRSVADGDRQHARSRLGSVRHAAREGILSWVFLAFYAVAVLSWYLYTKTGTKFGILPRHIRKTLTSLFGDRPIGGGSTAKRIQESYATLSIDLARDLYLVIGVLMIIGLAAVYYDRFLADGDAAPADEFLAIATTMLGTFVFTLAVPGAWGGGRPMMIVFTFTSVLAVLGTVTVVTGVATLGRVLSTRRPSQAAIRSAGTSAFAVLLAVLLVLNTGVAAATVLGGRAPSNVPGNVESNPHFDAEMETHVWLIVNKRAPVYGDVRAHGQSDWFRPIFAVRSEAAAFGYGGNKPRGELHTVLEMSGLERGYLVLLHHNVEEGVVQVGNPQSNSPDEYSLSAYRSELDRRSIIYTTGATRISYSNVTTGEELD
jgi:uncharacterized membrane protein